MNFVDIQFGFIVLSGIEKKMAGEGGRCGMLTINNPHDRHSREKDEAFFVYLVYPAMILPCLHKS